MDTFVGAANQEVDAKFVHVQRDAAETAHTVDNQFFAMHFDDVSEFFDGIQNPGSGFTMHKGNVGDIGIVAQVVVNVFYGYLLCLFKGEHIIVEVIIFGDITHTVAVGSVATNQKFVFRGDGCTQNGFYAVCTASLQKDRGVFFRVFSGDAHQVFAKFLNDTEVIVFVPCAPVGHHGFFYGF